MKRREFMSGLVAGIMVASPALAQDFVAGIIRQLRRQGFAEIAEQRTLLGRVRIIATRHDGRREIIVNPRNGEILRDLWMANAAGGRDIDIIDTDDDTDDDDDDDGNDDDDEDDRDGDHDY